MKYSAAPNNSRYVPFTQQHSCCVPTSIQMIMYRNDISLVPAEELGYHMGLTVAPENQHLFYDVRSSETPPSEAGYGTQIFEPEYNPNKTFERFGIPLKFHLLPASEIANEEQLLKLLTDIEEEDGDALLCFNHGVIKGEFKPYTGHVVVFDRVVDGEVQIVDASPSQPKWRKVKTGLLFEAIRRHADNSGGIWYFDRA